MMKADLCSALGHLSNEEVIRAMMKALSVAIYKAILF